MKLRPVSLEMKRLSVELPAPVGGHGHRTQTRSGVVLSLRDRDERRGLGESTPLPGYCPDTLEAVVQALGRLDVRSLSLNAPNFGFHRKLEDLVARRVAPVRGARTAVESAMLDLVSQQLELPAWKLLSITEPVEQLPLLPLSALLDGEQDGALLELAEQRLDAGFHTLKLKLRGPDAVDADCARIAELRRRFGMEFRLRLDANRAYPLPQARDLLSRLVPYAPEFVEEPVPTEQLSQLSEPAVPLALDESLAQPGLLESALGRRRELGLTAIVLKPSLLGLFRARRFAMAARELGLGVVVTHLFDGPVAMAAAVALAHGIGDTGFAQGLCPHPALALERRLQVLGLAGTFAAAVPMAGLPLAELR